MAVGVVDTLEVIDVDQEDREETGKPAGAGMFLADPPEGLATVEKPRQGIPGGHLDEHAFRVFQIRDERFRDQVDDRKKKGHDAQGGYGEVNPIPLYLPHDRGGPDRDADAAQDLAFPSGSMALQARLLEN